MTSVMRPSGPLPTRVYWVRRLLLCGLVVVLLSMLWWVFAPEGGGQEPGAGAGTPTTASESSDPSDPLASSEPSPSGVTRPVDPEPSMTRTEPTPPEVEPTNGHGEGRGTTPPTRVQETQTPLAQPTGPCSPGAIDMEIDVSDSAVGKSNVATLILTSTASPACTLAVTPDTLVARVTSGNDVVWSSTECPQELLAKEIVVRADPPSAYQLVWDGSRSTSDCRGEGPTPDPGGYWVEAALVGGEPHRAFFDITG